MGQGGVVHALAHRHAVEWGKGSGSSIRSLPPLQDLNRRLREEQDAEFRSSLEADRWVCWECGVGLSTPAKVGLRRKHGVTLREYSSAVSPGAKTLHHNPVHCNHRKRQADAEAAAARQAAEERRKEEEVLEAR